MFIKFKYPWHKQENGFEGSKQAFILSSKIHRWPFCWSIPDTIAPAIASANGCFTDFLLIDYYPKWPITKQDNDHESGSPLPTTPATAHKQTNGWCGDVHSRTWASWGLSREDTRLLCLSQGLGVAGQTGALGVGDEEHQVGLGQLLRQVQPVDVNNQPKQP